MKGKRTIVDEKLYEYIIDNFVFENDNLKKLREIYKKEKIPQISITPEQGKLLFVMAKMIKAKNILEIGTLIGYSAIWLVEALPEDGKIITIEISKKHYDIASNFIKKINKEHIIEVLFGDALELWSDLEEKAPFDIIFIDADKKKYTLYFNKALKLVRSGGLIIMDNALSKGRVLDKNETKRGVIGVREMNKLMGQSCELDSILIPIADGLAIGLKK